MDLLSLCGTALLGIILIFIFKQLKSEYAVPLAVLFCLVLLSRIIDVFYDNFNSVKELFNETALGDFWNIMLKIFGISLLVETTSDICRDMGENSIASKIELAGKAELLLISFPLIEKILEITKEIML